MLYVEMEKKTVDEKKDPGNYHLEWNERKKEHQIIDCHDRDKLKQYIFKLSKCRKYLTQWFIRLQQLVHYTNSDVCLHTITTKSYYSKLKFSQRAFCLCF